MFVLNVLSEYLSTYFDELEPREFYREIFPEGELDEKDSFTEGKYTGIIVEVTKEKKNNGKPKIKRHTLTDDLDKIDEVLKSHHFCLTSPISYAGKSRHAENARFMYAMAFDLDHIIMNKRGEPQGLIDLLIGHIERSGRLPNPTMIVSSGTGLHLYYVFENPIPLFENVSKQLQRYKYEMTRMLWNEGIVNIKSDNEIQQEGIYQGFRMPGTITKHGERARAFITGTKLTMEHMNSFVEAKFRVTDYRYKSNLTLAEAKKKYPEWYEKRIEQNQPRGSWNLSRNVYDWWKRQIYSGAKVGHRYYCLMALVIYAKKCSMYDPKHNPNPVTREELEKDAFEIMEYFESLTENEDNHFDEGDVLDALEAFEDKFILYPRKNIEERAGIQIKANKRNNRKQSQHLERARAVQKIDYPSDEWRNKDGRPDKEFLVREHLDSYPNDSPSQIAKDLGISRTTVYKYMKKKEKNDE